jgi:hypothetical protein
MSPTASPPERPKDGSPAYRVVRSEPAFELRAYAPYLVAEVTVPGPAEAASSAGFRFLAGYIFGKNRAATKMAMTAPVTQRAASETLAMTAPVTQVASANGFVVQFVMPPGYTLATLPVPDDPRVSLHEVAAHHMAVLRFSGRWTPENYAQHLNELRTALASAGITTEGEPVLARYDAPYVLPFLRRNEIWLRVGEAP